MNDPTLTELPPWLITSLPWLLALFAILGTACAIGLWMLIAQVRGWISLANVWSRWKS